MFNRTLQVKVLKPKKADQLETERVVELDTTKWDTICYTVDRAVKTIGIAAIGYVVVDTVRQVLVTQAANPPQ